MRRAHQTVIVTRTSQQSKGRGQRAEPPQGPRGQRGGVLPGVDPAAVQQLVLTLRRVPHTSQQDSALPEAACRPAPAATDSEGATFSDACPRQQHAAEPGLRQRGGRLDWRHHADDKRNDQRLVGAKYAADIVYA